MRNHNQIIKNQRRMKWMKDNYGDDYMLMFGNMLLATNDIQVSINECYKFFTKKYRNNGLTN